MVTLWTRIHLGVSHQWVSIVNSQLVIIFSCSLYSLRVFFLNTYIVEERDSQWPDLFQLSGRLCKVTQIINLYNRGKQKSILRHTTWDKCCTTEWDQIKCHSYQPGTGSYRKWQWVQAQSKWTAVEKHSYISVNHFPSITFGFYQVCGVKTFQCDLLPYIPT